MLHGNGLTGEIPAELGMATNLKALYLYDNMLTGSIPAELGNLMTDADDTIRLLYLHNNMLSGDIPAELGNLTSLTRILLRGNMLTGCVPAAIADAAVDLGQVWPDGLRQTTGARQDTTDRGGRTHRPPRTAHKTSFPRRRESTETRGAAREIPAAPFFVVVGERLFVVPAEAGTHEGSGMGSVCTGTTVGPSPVLPSGSPSPTTRGQVLHGDDGGARGNDGGAIPSSSPLGSRPRLLGDRFYTETTGGTTGGMMAFP